jgi:hypothetical protein
MQVPNKVVEKIIPILLYVHEMHPETWPESIGLRDELIRCDERDKMSHRIRTNLDREILSIEDAKAYLRELQDNNEAYHPDDSADTIAWGHNAPDENECILLDSLMDACRDFLDPCEELIALSHKDKVYEVETADTFSEGVSGYVLYLSNIQDEAFGEYLNVGEVGDKFDNGSVKIKRTK